MWVAALALSAFVVCYAPWLIRNYLTFDRMVVLTSKGETAQRWSYYQQKYVADGSSLKAARARAKQHLDDMQAAGMLGRPVEGRLSKTNARHTLDRFLIMLGAHPCLELLFPFAGCSLPVPRPILWFHYIWCPTMWLCVAISAVVSVRRLDLRVLHTIALPFTLLVLYSLVHAIPRYQTVSYLALCVPAGIGLSVILNRSYRAIRPVGRKR